MDQEDVISVGSSWGFGPEPTYPHKLLGKVAESTTAQSTSRVQMAETKMTAASGTFLSELAQRTETA